jgi:hypothetical protein
VSMPLSLIQTETSLRSAACRKKTRERMTEKTATKPKGFTDEGKRSYEGTHPRAEGSGGQGGRRKRSARKDRPHAGTGSRHGQEAPRHHQGQRVNPLTEALVRHARVLQGDAVVCFFQPAAKFKTRYATLGFSDKANLDEGAMWPVAFALKGLTAAEEARIGALVNKAVG